MRFKSQKTGGYQVFAVRERTPSRSASTSTAPIRAACSGLPWSAAIPPKSERFFVFGFKVFPSVIRNPDKKTAVKTFDHPVQSFVWDDFTAKPDRVYEYIFHPLKGTPKNLDRRAKPISIKVRTEPLFSEARARHLLQSRRRQQPGLCARVRQQEARRAREDRPGGSEGGARMAEPQPRRRHLEIHRQRQEERYAAVLLLRVSLRAGRRCATEGSRRRRRRAARRRRQGERDDRQEGQETRELPARRESRDARRRRIPTKNVILREAKPNNIAHNKFMVLLKGKSQSAGRSVDRLHEHFRRRDSRPDQCRALGPQQGRRHRVRGLLESAQRRPGTRTAATDKATAAAQEQGAPRRRGGAARRRRRRSTKWKKGITPVFSPRSGPTVLDMYAHMVDEAKDLSCITLAFGISEVFKTLLATTRRTATSPFSCWRRRTSPTRAARRSSSGSMRPTMSTRRGARSCAEPLYQWAKETNAKKLGAQPARQLHPLEIPADGSR